MPQLNTNLNLRSEANSRINITTNDNAITIQGQGPDGYENKSFLLSDPDLDTKVTNMLSKLKTHQRSELEDFINNALASFDEEASKIDSELNDFLTQLN